VVEKGAIGLG